MNQRTTVPPFGPGAPLGSGSGVTIATVAVGLAVGVPVGWAATGVPVGWAAAGVAVGWAATGVAVGWAAGDGVTAGVLVQAMTTMTMATAMPMSGDLRWLELMPPPCEMD